jgi:hypothetical protein
MVATLAMSVVWSADGLAAGKENIPPSVLTPSVAGSFYPSDEAILRADIAAYLKSAELPEIEGEIVAAIVPHAGYIYSGPIAAYAYKALGEQEAGRAPEEPALDAAIVLGFSHRKPYPGVSVYYKGEVETPLGNIPVSETLATEFMKSGSRLSFNADVFRGEHSAEVQMPFIKATLPGVPVVPVIFGGRRSKNISAVVEALNNIAADNRVLVLASTDLSHYHTYETANRLDAETIAMILKGDPDKMARFIVEQRDRMCGPSPVLTVLAFAKSQGARPVLLKYANSGDTAGKKDGVVGYVAIVFVRDRQGAVEKSGPKSEAGEEDEYLSEGEKLYLLKLARRTLESVVRDKKLPAVEEPKERRLRENGAAFVTLRRDGRLRGCIGRMDAAMPLYKTIMNMAAAAATQDNRFRPVGPDELDDIHIEISVNTPLRAVSGPDEIILGKHGVVVSKGVRRGVYLPQVADETGWSKKQFLETLCMQKAGLAPDAYKKDADLFVFESIVFEEEL